MKDTTETQLPAIAQADQAMEEPQQSPPTEDKEMTATAQTPAAKKDPWQWQPKQDPWQQDHGTASQSNSSTEELFTEQQITRCYRAQLTPQEKASNQYSPLTTNQDPALRGVLKTIIKG